MGRGKGDGEKREGGNKLGDMMDVYAFACVLVCLCGHVFARV